MQERACLACGSTPAFFVWKRDGVATYACSARCRAHVTRRFLAYAAAPERMDVRKKG